MKEFLYGRKAIFSALIGLVIHLLPSHTVVAALQKAEPSPEASANYVPYKGHYPNFDDNPAFSKDMLLRIRPHLLPLDHPIKAKLDSLFAKGRVTKNANAFAAAGFVTLSVRPYSFAIIASHPDFPGYIFKLYFDSETRKKHDRAGWEWLVSRCIGADKVRRIIETYHLKYFTVPDKWLYPLPYDAKYSSKGQPIILIATDAELASHEESIQAWKNATHRHIDELFLILKDGYASSYLIWNIPYTIHGKFACVDTEHPEREPTYKTARQYLSEKMQHYWDKLVSKNKKK